MGRGRWRAATAAAEISSRDDVVASIFASAPPVRLPILEGQFCAPFSEPRRVWALSGPVHALCPPSPGTYPFSARHEQPLPPSARQPGGPSPSVPGSAAAVPMIPAAVLVTANNGSACVVTASPWVSGGEYSCSIEVGRSGSSFRFNTAARHVFTSSGNWSRGASRLVQTNTIVVKAGVMLDSRPTLGRCLFAEPFPKGSRASVSDSTLRSLATSPWYLQSTVTFKSLE